MLDPLLVVLFGTHQLAGSVKDYFFYPTYFANLSTTLRMPKAALCGPDELGGPFPFDKALLKKWTLSLVVIPTILALILHL